MANIVVNSYSTEAVLVSAARLAGRIAENSFVISSLLRRVNLEDSQMVGIANEKLLAARNRTLSIIEGTEVRNGAYRNLIPDDGEHGEDLLTELITRLEEFKTSLAEIKPELAEIKPEQSQLFMEVGSEFSRLSDSLNTLLNLTS